LPAYQDYTKRAKMTEVINFMSAAKTGVSEAYADLNALTGIDNSKAGLADASDITSRYVASVTVTDGVVVAEVQGIDSDCDGNNVTLTPVEKDGALEWTGTADSECTKFVP